METSDKRLVWDWINIRKHAIDYSREKGRQRKEKENLSNKNMRNQ